ncbi:MAG: hypothetical protein KY475_16470 [Planctomycetes bacterium]|nr:hypothetical protein [Planctomycetota bacterium]
MMAPELHFTSEQEPQVEEYRRLSGLAVTALILALLSPAAVLGQYAIAIPPLAAAFAVAALWRIHASGGDLSGRRLAAVSLVISLFFGAWAITDAFGQRWLMAHQAKQFCDGWLELVQEGKHYEAHQWTMDPHERLPPAISLEDYYGENEAARSSALQFIALAPLAEGEIPKLRDFRYLGNASVAWEFEKLVVTHRYQLTYEAGEELQSHEAELVAVRTLPPDSDVAYWQLRDLRTTRRNRFP